MGGGSCMVLERLRGLREPRLTRSVLEITLDD